MYHLSNTKADKVKLPENNRFVFGTSLSRQYLTANIPLLCEVFEKIY